MRKIKTLVNKLFSFRKNEKCYSTCQVALFGKKKLFQNGYFNPFSAHDVHFLSIEVGYNKSLVFVIMVYIVIHHEKGLFLQHKAYYRLWMIQVSTLPHECYKLQALYLFLLRVTLVIGVHL